MASERGYFGVGIYLPKNEINIGTLLRSANILGAKFVFTIGARYKHQCSDTLKTTRHVPMYNYNTFDDMRTGLPLDCLITAVEMCDDATELAKFNHPERTVYLLGAEDHGLPQDVLKKCHRCVKLHGDRSMNVSVAGSIVLHDRKTRGTRGMTK